LDAKDGTHLWAETYDRELSAASIFAIQDEITEQVVGTIAGVHGVISRARFAEVKRKPTENLDAYECVLRCSAYYSDNISPSEHAELRDALERAVRTDPGYADAWAWLTLIYLDEHRMNYNPRPDPLDRALEAARMAVASDPTNQGAHVALADAHFFRHEVDAFFAETERALALNPNNASMLASMGNHLHLAGDERGIALVRRAMKLDPFHPTWFYLPITAHHFQSGQYEQALAAAQRINIPGFYVAHMFLAAIYAELGRQSEAHSAMEELLKLRPGLTSEAFIEEERRWNIPDHWLRRMAEALRKAGLPE
jgi:tetratricopeptide (TPR) repeat protein